MQIASIIAIKMIITVKLKQNDLVKVKLLETKDIVHTAKPRVFSQLKMKFIFSQLAPFTKHLGIFFKKSFKKRIKLFGNPSTIS